MSTSIGVASPRLEARLAGALWLIVIVTGGFAFVAGSSVIVRGDAAATAARILASEPRFRLAFAADLVAGLCYTGVTVILYGLLKPVNRSASLLAAFFGLAGVASGAAIGVTRLAPLALLGGGPYLTALTTSQLQSLAYVFLRLQAQGSNISMMFFGCQCIAIGCLIARSTFLPRVLGVLLAVGGTSYVVNSFATFLAPAFAANLALYMVPAALIGEGALTLWLLVVGLDDERWRQQAATVWSSAAG